MKMNEYESNCTKMMLQIVLDGSSNLSVGGSLRGSPFRHLLAKEVGRKGSQEANFGAHPASFEWCNHCWFRKGKRYITLHYIPQCYDLLCNMIFQYLSYLHQFLVVCAINSLREDAANAV